MGTGIPKYCKMSFLNFLFCYLTLTDLILNVQIMILAIIYITFIIHLSNLYGPDLIISHIATENFKGPLPGLRQFLATVIHIYINNEECFFT